MKNILKYHLSGGFPMRIVLTHLFQPAHKIVFVMMLYAIATINAGYAQRYTRHKTADSMLYFFAGVSKVFAQRLVFDQWTRANFGITEPYRPAVYLDLGIINRKYDFGAEGNVGSAFETGGVYFGRRITGNQNPIGSWLNIGIGNFFSNFTNITPPTYNKVPAGQQLTLSYNSFYMSLVSKNYLNFLQYNATLGHNHIPVNMGFFVGAGWQPASRSWSYGYYDQDSVYHAQKLKPIPKLGKLQGTAGVFMGF